MLTGATHHANDVTERGVRETYVLDVEMPLDGVTDPRWRSLLAGLFTRQPDDRWGSAEVRAWLAGEDPDVIRPAILPGHGTRRTTNPITFRGAPTTTRGYSPRRWPGTRGSSRVARLARARLRQVAPG